MVNKRAPMTTMCLPEGVDRLNILMNKCPLDCLKKLIHDVVEHICRDQIPNYSEYKSNFSLEEFWDVTDLLKSLLIFDIKNHSKTDELKKNHENINEKILSLVREISNVRQDEILPALLNRTCAISNSSLKDFDWKLNLTLASDSISKLREPHLNLNMFLNKNGEKDLLSLELSKSELRLLISSLEAANKAMQQLES